MKFKTDKIRITKYVIYVGLILLWALPEYKKDWFASETGKFGHFDLLHILIFIAGIKLRWVHLKEILFIFISLAITIHLFLILTSLFHIETLTQYPGWIILPVIEIMICVLLLRLKRMEKGFNLQGIASQELT